MHPRRSDLPDTTRGILTFTTTTENPIQRGCICSLLYTSMSHYSGQNDFHSDDLELWKGLEHSVAARQLWWILLYARKLSTAIREREMKNTIKY